MLLFKEDEYLWFEYGNTNGCTAMDIRNGGSTSTTALRFSTMILGSTLFCVFFSVFSCTNHVVFHTYYTLSPYFFCLRVLPPLDIL